MEENYNCSYSVCLFSSCKEEFSCGFDLKQKLIDLFCAQFAKQNLNNKFESKSFHSQRDFQINSDS